jgi:hypothetical protein
MTFIQLFLLVVAAVVATYMYQNNRSTRSVVASCKRFIIYLGHMKHWQQIMYLMKLCRKAHGGGEILPLVQMSGRYIIGR